MILDPVDASSLFSAAYTSSAQMEGVQQRSLSRGLDLFASKDYENAIKEFKKSIGFSPRSENAVKAYQFIAQTYSKLNDSDGAISAYKQALKIDQVNPEIHTALANVYYFTKDYENALLEYKAAADYGPGEASYYSLGQGYMAVGKYSDAEIQFNKVKSLAKNSPAGDYGLGLVYAKQGKYDAAIRSFRDALDVKSDYYEAYSEMGFVLADSGRLDDASKIQSDLESIDTTLASQLRQYINSKTPPKILFSASSDFNSTTLGPGTALTALDSYLAAPDVTQTFTMKFFFSKSMDPVSVQNTFNWSIGRSANVGVGTSYNYGMAIPDTEVSIMSRPIGVYYDVATQSATVLFNISQNSSGDGTIDPGHIQFKFSGKDLDGIVVDSKYDQYAGLNGIA